MTPHQQNLLKVRTAVVKAVPEIGLSRWRCDKCNSQSFFGKDNVHLSIYNDCKGKINEEIEPGRPIRIADVLVAIDKPVKMFTKIPTVPIAVGIFLSMWNLRADSLDDQNNECLQFLASLLS